jgi:hypothetical protein
LADELLSYGSITSQGLHLSDITRTGDLESTDGIAVQPLFLDLTGVSLVDLPPLCPEIVDSFQLVPELASSARDDHLPSLNSLALQPQLTDSVVERTPNIKDTEPLVPKIKDSKGCN